MNSDGNFICGRNAKIIGDVFEYSGVGAAHEEVGVIKIQVPMSAELNYFECKITSRGTNCSIGIGIGADGYPLNRQPGWNRNGIGYHADDGCLYNQCGHGLAFAPTCTEGDRMGCGVDLPQDALGNVSVFFTKNGEQVGDLITIKMPTGGLHPLIGLHSKGEQVEYLGYSYRHPPISLLRVSTCFKYPFPILNFILNNGECLGGNTHDNFPYQSCLSCAKTIIT